MFLLRFEMPIRAWLTCCCSRICHHHILSKWSQPWQSDVISSCLNICKNKFLCWLNWKMGLHLFWVVWVSPNTSHPPVTVCAMGLSLNCHWLFMWVCFLCSCFERFFKQVNLKESKLIAKRRGGYLMDDFELIGLDYLWKVGHIWTAEDWCACV